jgi:uncharacterized membrane protein YphA (DoxX/SURF4 family)
LTRACFRVALGFLWLVTAVAKALSPTAFQRWLERDLSTAPEHSALVAYAVIMSELAIGVCVLWESRSARRFALTVASASWGAGALAAATALATRHGSHCGCFGQLAEADLASRLIVSGEIMWLSWELGRRRLHVPGEVLTGSRQL